MLKMQNDLAPIGLSTYARLQHLQLTIEALKKNSLATQSELYVFSDAPKPGDEERVAEVRRYLRSIDGFKEIHIVERESNNRAANNRGGMNMLLELYGKMIFVAEDVVTAPGFLQYMNDALSRYEDDKRVFSITGWCPNFIHEPRLPKGSTFFSPRFTGWGMGIWKDRFEKMKAFSLEDVEKLKTNHVAMRRIYEQMGSDILAMFAADALGRIDAGDVRCCYHQAITGELTLHPYPALSRNIGLDGTGEHCEKQQFEFNGELGEDQIEYVLPENVLVDKNVAKLFVAAHQRDMPLLQKVKEKLLLLIMQ